MCSAAGPRATNSRWAPKSTGGARIDWNDEVAGANALLTRVKRLVFRVPRYARATAR